MCEHVASRLFARFVPYLSFHGGWVFLLVHCEQHSVNLNAKTSVVDRTGDIRDEDRRWHVRYCNLKNLERSHSMGTAVAGKALILKTCHSTSLFSFFYLKTTSRKG
ncbi:uncharacterized protein [Montipora capricornis]|uniref:uncharacterized protein isoform X2 n=1 Tax=Montipora capricornis TaxID=246305 RepID=UPI0035F16102